MMWSSVAPRTPLPGPSEIEIRPFYELEDFAEAMTPEQAEREERMSGGVGGAVGNACDGTVVISRRTSRSQMIYCPYTDRDIPDSRADSEHDYSPVFGRR